MFTAGRLLFIKMMQEGSLRTVTYPVTGPVVGVVGGGQLARMMTPAAIELGIDLRVLAEAPDVSAVPVVKTVPVGNYKNLDTLRQFAAGLDVLTFDHEHVPGDFLQTLIDEGVNVQPRPQALIHAQDKIEMRRAVDRLGLPNPAWAQVRSVDDLLACGDSIGWPLVLKTPRGGYDGKGVLILDDASAAQSEEVLSWFKNLENQDDFSSLLLEQKVPFTRELSVLVARRDSGEVRTWPVAESIQVNSVCDEVIAPAPSLDSRTAQAASQAAMAIASELDVTGVMAVELFEVPGTEQGFIINELAMRPHNSGHWTQDGSVTSQFEQHLRAVLNLPLGATEVKGEVALMKNFLGGSNEDLFATLPTVLEKDAGAKVHLYGKDVRPGRKIGHINMTGAAAELEALRASAAECAQYFTHGIR